MVNTLLAIIIAVVIVSVISLVGIAVLLINKKRLSTIIVFMVSFATGSLFGAAFFDLLPEAVEEAGFTFSISLYILLGIITFFIIEGFLNWYHCHVYGRCEVHTFTFMSLVGDAVHNFIDGMVIATSFLISIPVGIATTIAVAIHEIPQELGDFSILLYGGFSKMKALAYNFLTALFAVAGALVVYFLALSSEKFIPSLAAFAAGGFIYIAGSDLLPELHKEKRLSFIILQLLSVIAGLAIIGLVTFYAAE